MQRAFFAVALVSIALVLPCRSGERPDPAARLAEAQRQTAVLMLEKGQGLCEQGDVARGVFWIARSLELAPAGAADLQRVIRVNLGGWREQLRPVRGILSHIGMTFAVAISPDGKKVVTGSYDKTARLWDAATGQPIGEARSHPDKIDLVVFSPDSQRFVTGCFDRKGRIFDVATGKLLGAFPGHQPYSRDIVFSTDGKTILSGGGNQASFWDGSTGKPAAKPLPLPAALTASAYSTDGKVIATGCDNGVLQLWSAETSKPIGGP